MNTYFVTVGLITLFFALILVVSIVFNYRKYENSYYDNGNSLTKTGITVSIIALAILVILFLLIVPIFNTKYYKAEKVDVVITKSQSKVFAEIGDQTTLMFDLKSEYDKIDSTTQFYKIQQWNYYGYDNGVVYSYDPYFMTRCGYTIYNYDIDEKILNNEIIMKNKVK